MRPTQQILAQVNSAPGILDWLISPVQALPNNGGGLYYVHVDALGTPQALTDETGTTVWTAVYDPFGQATVNEDPDGDGIDIEFNARFPGQYYDQETGLHYNLMRYYSPETGRYITADPLGIVPDPKATQSNLNHLYAYAENNPIIKIDPDGLLPGFPWPAPNDPLPYDPGYSPTPGNCAHYPPGTLRDICQGTPNNPDMNCARKCLKDVFPGGYGSFGWYAVDHPVCWYECNITPDDFCGE